MIAKLAEIVLHIQVNHYRFDRFLPAAKPLKETPSSESLSALPRFFAPVPLVIWLRSVGGGAALVVPVRRLATISVFDFKVLSSTESLASGMAAIIAPKSSVSSSAVAANLPLVLRDAGRVTSSSETGSSDSG
jgi:hypothetical protein